MRQRLDVVVVGGGPAGSSLAGDLVRRGLAVAVLDQATFPRDKTCAGWITPAVIESLGLDTGDYARAHVFQPIHGFRIAVIGGEELEVRYPDRPVSYGIRRCEFDAYLLRRSGAELHLGQRVARMTDGPDGWEVNGALHAGTLVGAGGHFCPVARRLGANPRTERVVVAQEIEFEMTEGQRAGCPVEAEVPELYFCPDLRGYGWVFRKGNHLNVGLGRDDTDRLGEHVAGFREYLVRRGRVPSDVPQRFHGHAYRLYTHTRHAVVGDAVLLVGDAAGLAYPESGEGIGPAVESGLLAAGVIAAAEGRYGREALRAYEDELSRRFGSREPNPGPSRWLPTWLRQLVAGRLLTTEWFARRIVLDRWFLHLHESARGVRG